ncbi:histidine kinase [Microbacterium sp.]|uniref:sensor histidine kinase n=1 Tax=Microbacterium sp. TaxID=51671 RepID=UPI0028125336|nr:histidine kinase [Microbacterium sp.]
MVPEARRLIPAAESPERAIRARMLRESMMTVKQETDAVRTARAWYTWLRADVIVALVVLVVLLPASIATITRADLRPDGATIALAIPLFAGLHAMSLLATRIPVAAFAGASAIMAALALVPSIQQISGVLFPSSVAYLLVLGQVALQCQPIRGLLALGSGVFGAALIAFTEPGFDGPLRWGAFLGLIGAVSAAWAVGALLRLRRMQTEERMQASVERAIVDERMRINRDLHDIVAHSMTVMIAQAEVARALLRDDVERSDHALGIVIESGRDALRGMRSAVAVGDAPLGPLPTISSIAELVEAVRRPGSEVTLEEDGDRTPLRPDVMLALHHAVREALTNAVRHTSPPVRIDVSLVWTGTGVTATVTDDGGAGPIRADAGRELGTGTGLIGVSERVRQAGGILSARERTPRGWTVRVELPGADAARGSAS